MQDARIVCDLCRAVVPLENADTAVSLLRVPPGWASVNPQVRLRGIEDRGERRRVKELIGKMIPTVHLCPDCIADPAKKEEEERTAREIRALVEPPPRQIQGGP